MPSPDAYKGIKIIGYVTFIPFMLAAGPLTGYLAGSFLQHKFNLSNNFLILSTGLGFAAGFMEVVRILKVIVKINKK